MFTIVIYEIPQRKEGMPLFDGIESKDADKPIVRLRVSVSKLTEAGMKKISAMAWKFPRKTRKDKGIQRKRKAPPC